MTKCVVCGRERTDLIDDQCADCTMDDFRESIGQPRKFAPYGQGETLRSIAADPTQTLSGFPPREPPPTEQEAYLEYTTANSESMIEEEERLNAIIHDDNEDYDDGY